MLILIQILEVSDTDTLAINEWGALKNTKVKLIKSRVSRTSKLK